LPGAAASRDNRSTVLAILRHGGSLLLATLMVASRAGAQAPAPPAAVPPGATGQPGHLVVKAKAGRPTRVLVDGVDRGQAPWEGDVAPGPHVVSIGGAPPGAAAQHVDVEAGGTVAVLLDAGVATALDRAGDGEGHGPRTAAVASPPSVPGGGDRRARPPGGIYGGLGLVGRFEPAGAGSSLDTSCPELGATGCTAQAPRGGGIAGYVGYTWNPVGLELFVAGAFDEASPQASYSGQIAPGENPFLATPARTEAFTIYRGGGLVAIRARVTTETRYFRASLAAGVGAAYAQMLMRRTTTANDGTQAADLFTPGTTSYVSPALAVDGTVSLRIGGAVALAVGVYVWVENAGGNAATPPDPQRCFGSCSLGPATVPLPTPSYQLASSTQVFVGPYLGLQFGP